MKSYLCMMLSIALTAFCWGAYGPLLQRGGEAMEKSHWRPFQCVGLAYFVIAVLLPALWLKLRPELNTGSIAGMAWNSAAGVAGAIGALGVIKALAHGGSPLFVMPLVFGGAPVVNTLVTMTLASTHREAKPMLYVGLTLVIVGAMIVLAYNPAILSNAHAPLPEERAGTGTLSSFHKVLLFIALTVVSWGIYGPLLHTGQQLMHGSRLKPFMGVGMAYFVVAAVLPFVLGATSNDDGAFTLAGTVWSLIGGAAGALGALGMVLAFAFGGKPVFVTPLAFGGAPLVNTLISIVSAKNLAAISPYFYVGLLVVALGAAMVLIFAPRGAPSLVSSQPMG